MTKMINMKGSNFESDQKLVEALKHKDNRAYNFLYLKYRDKISRYLMARGADKETAEDIFQNTIIALSTSVLKSDFTLEKTIEGLLRVIARNIFFKEKRKRKRNLPLEESLVQIGEADLAIKNFESNEQIVQERLYKTLHQKIKALDPQRQYLLRLRYWEELQYKDIALRLNPNFAGNPTSIKREAERLKAKVFRIILSLRRQF